jgi:Plant specific eukaryotic initiation factor 4B
LKVGSFFRCASTFFCTQPDDVVCDLSGYDVSRCTYFLWLITLLVAFISTVPCQLKPRSARADRARRRSTSAKGDPFASPFGDARPREEVLMSRGIDIKAVDSRIEEKAAVPKFTKVRLSLKGDSPLVDPQFFGVAHLYYYCVSFRTRKLRLKLFVPS